MKINQISVFLENTKGRLYGICSLLGENEINIRALTLAESQDFGILRMVVDRTQQALDILKQEGFTSSLTEIVAVEVNDTPGGLARVLGVLKDSDINVEYMYGFMEKSADKALMVFRFEDMDGAIKLLLDNNIVVVCNRDIPGI